MTTIARPSQIAHQSSFSHSSRQRSGAIEIEDLCNSAFAIVWLLASMYVCEELASLGAARQGFGKNKKKAVLELSRNSVSVPKRLNSEKGRSRVRLSFRGAPEARTRNPEACSVQMCGFRIGASRRPE